MPVFCGVHILRIAFTSGHAHRATRIPVGAKVFPPMVFFSSSFLFSLFLSSFTFLFAGEIDPRETRLDIPNFDTLGFMRNIFFRILCEFVSNFVSVRETHRTANKRENTFSDRRRSPLYRT